MKKGSPTSCDVPQLRAAQTPDGVHEQVVRALSYPTVAVSPERRMRRVELGHLQTVLGQDGLQFSVVLTDRAGRVSARPLFKALSWSPGETFSGWAGQGFIAVQPARRGPLILDDRGRLLIPPAVLRYCGIATGDQALLTAITASRILVVHPITNLAHMVRSFHNDLHEREIHRAVIRLDDRR